MTASMKALPVDPHNCGKLLTSMGCKMFPVNIVREDGEVKKRPAIKDWQAAATNDVSQLLPSGTRQNYGVYTGALQDGRALCVIDIDIDEATGKNGFATIEDMATLGNELPPTFTVKTPRGGEHRYYVVDQPVTGRDLGLHVNTRSAGQFVVGPGSSGVAGAYRITDARPFAALPQWARDKLGTAAAKAANKGAMLPNIDAVRARGRAIEYLLTQPAAVEHAGSDSATFKIACEVRDRGVDEATALDLMLSEHWHDGCGFSEGWVAAKVASAYKTARGDGGSKAPEAVFSVIETPAGESPAMPAYLRSSGGKIEPTASNVVAALMRPDQCGARLAFDAFLGRTMFGTVNTWRAFVDADYTRLRIELERRGFKNVGKDIVRDAVDLACMENKLDSAIEWLTGLKWDGVARVDNFFAEYFGVEDSPYATGASRYWWSGLAGRVMEPGVKADMAIALSGPQGVGKTSGVEAMSPSPERLVEINLAHEDEKLARSLRGALIGEIAELRGLGSRDSDSIKSWISRRTETFRPLYREFQIDYPRRLMLAATTNQTEFLQDETGERRWLPMTVTKVNVDAIKRDRDQLWAEGAALFATHGVLWQDAARLAPERHREFKSDDAWADPISEWLDSPEPEIDAEGYPRATRGKPPRSAGTFRMGDLLTGAVRVATDRQTKALQMRAAKILKGMGFDNPVAWMDGKAARVWRKADLTAR